jgi:hypothetical protein
VKLAVALDLTLQPVKKITLEFRDFAATQAGHMNMIPLRAALIIVFFSLDVHQIKLVDQAMPFEQSQCPVDRHAIYLRI